MNTEHRTISKLPGTVNPYREYTIYSKKEGNRLKFTSSNPFIPIYVQSELKHSANLNPKNIYDTRIQGRQVALENPVRDSKDKKEANAQKGRRLEHEKKKKIGIIGRNEAKRTGIWKLNKDQAKYDLFLPLHQLWLGYMAELMNLSAPPTQQNSIPKMPNVANMHAKLVKADFHGSHLTVRRSKNPDLVGLSGIVIHETENAFRVITIKDAVKLIPKQNSVFVFCLPLYDTRKSPGSAEETSQGIIPQMEFELYGNQFRFRAAERASRKFKHKESIAL